VQKKIVIVCLILSGLLILDSMNVGHAFMMFFLAGVIPGTNVSLSAQTTMELFALLTGFVLARLLNRFYITFFDRLPARRQA
jgi:hypothetical protein